MKKWILTALAVSALVLPAAAFAGNDPTGGVLRTFGTGEVTIKGSSATIKNDPGDYGGVYSKNSPKKSRPGSHSDRAISYNTQLEPAPTSTIPAGAVSKQLWHSTHYDTIASTLAGFPITAAGEDDYTEWGSFLYPDDPYAVLGFTMIDAPPESPAYHHIYLAPPIWSTLTKIDSGGIDSIPRADAAMAILTLTHEAYHQRLYSGDESRVNACALRDFGSTIQSQFGVSPTVEQTVTTPIVTSHRVRQAAWRTVKGKRVRRYVYRLVSQTTYRNDTVVSDNPTYAELVSSAQTFVASQPPPYNTGTCF
jgi:hypothetical protein